MHSAFRATVAVAFSLLATSQLTADQPDSAVQPWHILIRPHNYDPIDPWEYTRRQGMLSPGMSATGPIWNRPTPLRQVRPAAVPEPPSVTKVAEPELVPLGYSVSGIPIVMHVYGRAAEPTLIFGGIHGDETNSAELARQLVEHLERHPEAYRDRCVAVIPVANPDGLARNSRTNARQVDVNRNFPARNWQPSTKGRYFGGESEASEPETRAIMRAVELLHPARIVTIHCITRGRHGNNYDGPGAKLAELMAARNRYRVLKSIGYPTPGSFGSWAGVDRQIPTITLELPHDLHGPDCWAENGEALLEAIRGDVSGRQVRPGDLDRSASAW